MKRRLSIAACCLWVACAGAADFTGGNWAIKYNEATKRLSVGYSGRPIFDGVYAEAKVGADTVRSYEASTVGFGRYGVDDCFGEGSCYRITYTMPSGTELVQTFAFYDGLPYFVTSLEVTGNGTIESNYAVPMKSCDTAGFMPSGRQNRVLFVPWDNDGFIRYGSNPLLGETNSHSVTAIYNADTREGLVAGAVDHDLWKSAVHVQCSDYDKVNGFALISGYTDEHTHDSILSEQGVMPHGTIVADTVSSARFVVGWFDDWRDGMEAFGKACTMVAPKREWAGGAPYGWSSWGVQSTDISYQGVIDCADFIRDNLVSRGFHDRQGKVVMSLDAWWNDNLTVDQVRQFVDYCKQNNMIPGLYYGSFCRFGDLNSYVPGTNNKYRFRDIALKVHGRFKVVDGAYCLDPTHVGTKQFIVSDMMKFKQWGIEYLKCDFMSNGAIEADSWYNKDCHTGVQAYNEGMAFLLKQAGDGIYIDLSISPVFPYQYAHGRRISCDAWGTIDQTKYVMNNASYGWWVNQLYVANDPDHMVMALRQEAGGIQGENANRARITSGAIVGAFLTGDNFSPNVTLHDGSGKERPNYYQTSRERALKLLTNEDINAIPRTCKSFRPVYGNASTAVGAESLMTYENEQYVYLAVFNYQILVPNIGIVSFADIGVDPSDVGEVKELWTGEVLHPSQEGISYNVPVCDARIYRIEKKGHPNGIVELSRPSDEGGATAFDLLGRRIPYSAVGSPTQGARRLYVLKQGNCVRKVFK